MFFNPFIELYFKYERHVHDFLIQAVFYVATYLADTVAITRFGYNNIFLSLAAFISYFFAARFVIKILGKEKLFGNFVNWGVGYCLFLALFSWVAYLFMIRIRMLS